MGDSDKFEDCKKEIRSILLPYQKGVFLVQFNRAYKEMIGRTLPFRELGYKSDIDLLYAMPDAVYITHRSGEYHLEAVADSSTQHIQKMVSKQKPTKLKPPPRSSKFSYSTRSYAPPRSYVLPPRFSEVRKTQPPPPKPEPKVAPVKPVTYSKPEPVSKVSPMEEVIALVQHFKNKLAVDDLLFEYNRMYNKTLSLSKYGFSTVEECIDDIPELEVVRRNNVSFVQYCSEAQAVSDEVKSDRFANELCASNSPRAYEEPTSDRTPLKTPSEYSTEYHNQNNGNLSKSLREKLEQIAKSYPEGVWAADFPKYFEEVTGYPLELGDLGYRCLSDLIDDASDIFSRKAVIGSRKDYIIYPTSNFKLDYEPVVETVLVDRIILNIRKILEAYPEGVKINEVLHIYSINCKDSLHISDFGFSDLTTFLMTMKHRVPLKFDYIDGERSIHLVKLSDDPADLHYMIPEACDDDTIPFDAAFPDFIYTPQIFPSDFDFTKFIPAYTSSVANAGHLYIQFEIDEAEIEEFLALAKELDAFYNGGSSEQYMMKNVHIKVGSSCVAKWPFDQRWYRAKILSIPSMQEVHVRYVDYGTEDTIPKYLLRYAKKNFTRLPAQAIRCRLAFLKPPNNATKWNIETRDRILKMCEDLRLMAKVEEIQPDGVHCIVLCDTNGPEDVYINDVLRNEGLAEYDVPDANQSTSQLEPEQEQFEYYHNLHPLQALKAKMYLESFATIAPSFAFNEHYIKLLKQISIYCPPNPVNSNILTQQNIAKPSVGPPGFNNIPSAASASSASHYLLQNTLPSTSAVATSPIKGPKDVIPPPISISDFYPTPHEHELTNAEGNNDGENEIFDDDEEMFQQFLDKNLSVKVRHVKRITLGDGYKIHIIVVETKPYASSGDISHLIWNNKEADYLLRRLQLKKIDIPAVNLSEDGNEELFAQLNRYNVKGVQKTTGFKSSILLYPLNVVIRILNIFGHPSVTLRTRLREEVTTFNPYDPQWNDLSPDISDTEEESTFTGATDDAKLERLCLYDLLAMKEALAYRKKKIMHDSTALNKSGLSGETDKLEQMYQKVIQRIQEINEICRSFS